MLGRPKVAHLLRSCSIISVTALLFLLVACELTRREKLESYFLGHEAQWQLIWQYIDARNTRPPSSYVLTTTDLTHERFPLNSQDASWLKELLGHYTVSVCKETVEGPIHVGLCRNPIYWRDMPAENWSFYYLPSASPGSLKLKELIECSANPMRMGESGYEVGCWKCGQSWIAEFEE